MQKYITGLAIIISLFLTSCKSDTGYRVYLYLMGDLNHTMYEDTIIWGDKDKAEKYANELRKSYIIDGVWDLSIIHIDQVTRLNCPKTNRVTKQQIYPRINWGKPSPRTTLPKDTTVKSTSPKPIKKKDNEDRFIHFRSNGSVDMGSGPASYNVRSGKMGVRVSKHVVYDSDGFHLSW